MSPTTRQRTAIALTLAVVMMATRINHFGNIPDASWAVFFLGGFYLTGMTAWAFPALMGLAVGIDYMVISSSGLSFWNHYCVSPAYWFLLPAHLSLWLGGMWLRRHFSGLNLPSLGFLVGSMLSAVSVCFLIANGSFYWLSDSVTAPSLAGWGKNLSDWYLPYLHSTAIYMALASILHLLIAQASARVQAVSEPRLPR